MNKIMMDKMTINLTEFSLFMEDINVSNLNDTPIITIKRSGRGCEHAHLNP